MKKTIIYGFYGEKNLGDDLILYSIIKQINNKNKDIVALSSNDDFISNLNLKTCKRFSLSSLYHILTSDYFIWGGGGLIQDKTSIFSLPIHLFYPFFAKIFNKKVFVWSIGVDELKFLFSKKITQFVLNKVDYISVRDKRSEYILRKLGIKKKIEVVSDPVIRIKKILRSRNIKSNKYIGISLRPFDDMGTFYNTFNDMEKSVRIKKFIDYFSREIDLIKKENPNKEFIFFSFHPDDLRIYNLLKLKIDYISLEDPFKNFKEFINKIAKCEIMIGMRLHSLILSAAYNVMPFCLNHTNKNIQFIKDLGLEEILIDMNNLDINQKIRFFYKNKIRLNKILETQKNKLVKKQNLGKVLDKYETTPSHSLPLTLHSRLT